MRRAGGAATLLALAATACGSVPAPPGTPASVPSASSPQTFVMLVLQQGAAPEARFVARDGSELRRVPLPQDARFATVGGQWLSYVSSGHLHVVGESGTDQDRGALSGMDATDPGWGGLAVSPDGLRWAWSYLVGDPNRSPLHSRLEIGGLHEQPRVMLDESHDDAPLYLEPIAWTDAGLVVADQPGNIGGFPLFFDDRYWGATRLLDPITGATRRLTSGQACPFNDGIAGGGFTCVAAQPWRVVLTTSSGARTFAIPGVVAQAGDALVDAAGRRIAVGINRSDSTGQPDQRWQVETALIDVSTGGLTILPGNGHVPSSWLPDGSLVVVDVLTPRVGAQNSASILAPDLRSRVSLGDGLYLGALDARHAIAAHTPVG